MTDEAVSLFPTLIDEHLVSPLLTDGAATEQQVKALIQFLALVASILRAHQSEESSTQSPVKFLRLLLKDRYAECLLEFYARHKIEDRKARQLF